MRKVVLGVIALAIVSGCSSTGSPKDKSSAQITASMPSKGNSCRDDGPRLKDTGICTVSFGGYASMVDGREPQLPAGCAWTVNDTLIADGSEALLYRAAECKGVVTKLEYGGGAHSAAFAYSESAVFGASAKSQELIQMFPIPEGQDGKAMLLDMAKATTKNKAEAAACEVRLANIEGWPKDALVIDVKDKFKAKNKKAYAEVYAACGQWGVDTDSQTFWRVAQGYAWHYALGQAESDIDPRSVTLIRKSADGAWGAVE